MVALDRFQLAQVFLETMVSCFLMSLPMQCATIEWLTLFLKNSKENSIIYHPWSLFPRCSFYMNLSWVEELVWQKYQRVQDMFASSWTGWAWCSSSSQRNNFTSRISLDETTTSARATKQQARINRFHDLKEVSDTSVETDLSMNFETSRIGKRSSSLGCFLCPYDDKPILQDFNLCS